MPSFVNEIVRHVSRRTPFLAYSNDEYSDPERDERVARPIGARRRSLLPQDMSGTAEATSSVKPTSPSYNVGDPSITIILVGMKAGGFLDHFDLLAENALNVAAASDIAAATAVKFSGSRDMAHMLLVDMDAVAPGQRIVEDLIAFRKYTSATPVVIGSRKFRGNDFSMERSVIADASVRLPASSMDMEIALSVAIENNSRLAA